LFPGHWRPDRFRSPILRSSPRRRRNEPSRSFHVTFGCVVSAVSRCQIALDGVALTIHSVRLANPEAIHFESPNRWVSAARPFWAHGNSRICTRFSLATCSEVLTMSNDQATPQRHRPKTAPSPFDAAPSRHPFPTPSARSPFLFPRLKVRSFAPICETGLPASRSAVAARTSRWSIRRQSHYAAVGALTGRIAFLFALISAIEDHKAQHPSEGWCWASFEPQRT